MKIDNLVQRSWLVVLMLGIGVAFMGSNLESHSQKFGVIDREKLGQKSKFITNKYEELQHKANVRMELLKYVESNKIITDIQVKELKELALKVDADKVSQEKIDKLKKEVDIAEKEYLALSQKTDLTDKEKEKLREYSRLSTSSHQLLQGFKYQVMEEFKGMENQLESEINHKIDEAVAKISKSKGFTLVYNKLAVAYSPNDVTDATIDELDKNK